MMNEREKSDPVTVAAKSTNEAGQPGEEWMEPRAGTKGNADWQSTLQAQDRAGVSQALGRIRKAARQSKTEKFTTLLHHVDVRLLRESYLSLRRDASSGADGMTWKDYGLGCGGSAPKWSVANSIWATRYADAMKEEQFRHVADRK
jgi:RNA-directed DNA polymerase